MTTSTLNLSEFIGIPFVSKAQLFSGADCYGLVTLYYKYVLGIDIPSFIIAHDSVRRVFLAYLNEISKNWVRIDKPEQHCGVAIKMNDQHPKMVTHFGVMIDDHRLLHTLEKMGSHIIDIDSPLVKNKIEGFYRWQPLPL